MKILLKWALRNMTIKPLRTVVIILCLAAVSLTFSMCFTISYSSKEAIDKQIRRNTGSADIVLSSAKGLSELPVLPEGTQSVPLIRSTTYLQKHDIKNYKYAKKINVMMISAEGESAARFGLLPEYAAPSDGEAVITNEMSINFGFEKGDSVTFPCKDGSCVTLTVSGVILKKGLLELRPLAVIVSPQTARKLAASPELTATEIYIDAPEGKETQVSEKLSAMYPDLSVQQIIGNPETEESTKSITGSFFFIFVITLLMIFFIISSFSKNIAAERLSVIGTLRSIGAEKKTAAAALLAECTCYGVLGGIFGTLLFFAVKDSFLGNMIPTVAGASSKVYAPAYIIMIGLVLSAVISCAVSLVSVLRTAKTPVRDIIFGGKDTVYRPSNTAAVCGAVLFSAGLGLCFLKAVTVLCIFGLTAFVAGVCMTVPKLLSLASSFTAKHTNGRTAPVLRLAAIQAGTKKTAVTATVICTAVILLTASLYALSDSITKLYSARVYSCDAVISELSEHSERYDTITAESKEYIYNTSEKASINGTATNVNVFGYNGFTMFGGISGLPDRLADDEITLDKQLMKRLGIGEGETLTITLKNDSLRPISLTLKTVSGIDSIYVDTNCNAALISLDTYKKVYHDYPSMLLLKGDTELMKRQLIDKGAIFETIEEYNTRSEESYESIIVLLAALSVTGVLLAVISVSGNQMIGFELRRHELAVLRSQGMSVSQLSRMVFCETVFTAAIPAAIYLCFGRIVLKYIELTLSSLDTQIPLSFEAGRIAVFLLIIAAAVILTALIPVRLLRKMNTSAELKCE